jgi:microsomal dipeptidase-like Zn-dependent dipeptidase
LDSLENEWVDIQLVTVRPDVTKEPAQRMAELVTLLDEATGVKSDFSKPGNASTAFSSRRENFLSMVGLEGAESVGSDISHLRIAAKMGATYIVLDGANGTWISPESGLTETGQEAVETMNAQKMLILLQNQSQDVMTQIIDASTHPVIVTGVTDVLALSDDFLQKVHEKGGLLALPISQDSEAEEVVGQMEAIQERIDLKHLVFYPQAGSDLCVDKLDEMLQITIALHEKGVEEEAIMGLLGGHLESAFKKIFQIKPARMRF